MNLKNLLCKNIVDSTYTFDDTNIEHYTISIDGIYSVIGKIFSKYDGLIVAQRINLDTDSTRYELFHSTDVASEAYDMVDGEDSKNGVDLLNIDGHLVLAIYGQTVTKNGQDYISEVQYTFKVVQEDLSNLTIYEMDDLQFNQHELKKLYDSSTEYVK